MAIKYNGTDITDVKFNGTDVTEVIYNGTKVFKKSTGVTLEAGTYKWKDTLAAPTSNLGTINMQFVDSASNNYIGIIVSTSTMQYSISDVTNEKAYSISADNWFSDDFKTITTSTDQTVSQEFYDWAITGGNLVKQAEGETWVLNEDLTAQSVLSQVNIKFKDSDDTLHSSISALTFTETGEPPDSSYGVLYDGAYVYTAKSGVTGSWGKDAYRTITFLTSPTGDLLTWLQANGTKQ